MYQRVPPINSLLRVFVCARVCLWIYIYIYKNVCGSVVRDRCLLIQQLCTANSAQFSRQKTWCHTDAHGNSPLLIFSPFNSSSHSTLSCSLFLLLFLPLSSLSHTHNPTLCVFTSAFQLDALSRGEFLVQALLSQFPQMILSSSAELRHEKYKLSGT